MTMMNREELNKLYKTPANLKLKYIALCVIGVAIALMIACIFLMDTISWRLLLFMRGCAGVLAFIFIVLVAILIYRVNSAYLKNRR